MKKACYASLLAMCLLFFSCQGNESSETVQGNEYTVFITAKIGKPIPEGRYQQENEEAAANFKAGDDIGVFMDEEAVTHFTFDNSAWTTDKTLYWADKDKKHTFCAYYPYDEMEISTKEAVPMPSLGGQNGSWENLEQYDFLAATQTLSYNDNRGNVTFTGDNAFKHITSLLKINIVGEGDMASAVINEIVLQGENLITLTHYSFETGEVTMEATPENELVIAPDFQMENSDKAFYFILNGEKKVNEETLPDNPVSLAITYTCGDKQYIAKREGLVQSLLSGCIHKYKIQIKGGDVIITGGEISGWTPGNEEETIIINGEEITDTNQ